MNVLVTGGAGFIGSHVVDALLADGHRVVVVDDLSTGRADNLPVGVQLIQLDILDPSLADVLVEERPDVICHHAGQTDLRRSIDDPLLDARINTLGGLNVIRAAVATGVRKVIYASTAAVYGEPDALPVAESSPPRPISGYGVSKFAVEAYLHVAARDDDLDYTVLRYSNVYGPRQRSDGEAGVVAIFAQRLLTGKGVTIFGDGRQTRDFVFVGDVARANRMVIGDHGRREVFNIGSGERTSVLALHAALAGSLGAQAPPEHAAANSGEIRHMRFDISRARSVLGWTPEVSLDDGLAATLDHLRATVGTRA